MKDALVVVICLFMINCQPEGRKTRAIAVDADSVRLPLAYAIIKPDSSQLKYQFILH